MKIDGYVITMPVNSWDDRPFNPFLTSFSTTTASAWLRFIGPDVPEMDRSRIIQSYHDKGYRVKKATMEIEE